MDIQNSFLYHPLNAIKTKIALVLEKTFTKNKLQLTFQVYYNVVYIEMVLVKKLSKHNVNVIIEIIIIVKKI